MDQKTLSLPLCKHLDAHTSTAEVLPTTEDVIRSVQYNSCSIVSYCTAEKEKCSLFIGDMDAHPFGPKENTDPFLQWIRKRKDMSIRTKGKKHKEILCASL